jgi:hypothetical protein
MMQLGGGPCSSEHDFPTAPRRRSFPTFDQESVVIKLLVVVGLLSQAFLAQASELSLCTAADGAMLTGTVTKAPTFAAAKTTIKGIKLSHTHLTLRADQDGKSYDVAMDNVFALDYVKNASAMPKSLAAIKLNDRLELCGAKYTGGDVGIHWVHTNCGDTPATTAPDGWVKTIAANGAIGANLERSQTYCYLWN